MKLTQNPFDTFRYYRALKLHFNSDSYDFFKYHGKTKNATQHDFETSKEKIWCENITKKYGKQTPSFLLANLSEKPELYIRDLATLEECDKIYNSWLTRRKATAYFFKKDMSLVSNDLFEETHCDENTLPPIFLKYIKGDISRDSLCIVLEHTLTLKDWGYCMKDNIIWKLHKRKIEKYLPFVPDKPEYTEILVDKWSKVG